MDLKRTGLAGISAAALILAAANVSADGIDQRIDIGIGNAIGGLDAYNAVAGTALQQNSVQIATPNIDVVTAGNYSGGIVFGDNTFRNQSFSINNFNTGGNATQSGEISVTFTTNVGGGSL